MCFKKILLIFLIISCSTKNGTLKNTPNIKQQIPNENSHIINKNKLRTTNVSFVKIEQQNTFQQSSLNTPNSLTYYFKICLVGSQNIKNKHFFINSPLEDEKIITLAEDNCMYWNEVLVFDFFSPSVNLQVYFTFKSYDKKYAKISKTIIINPWEITRGNNNGVLDITFYKNITSNQAKLVSSKSDIDKALKGQLHIKGGETSKLAISSLSIFPTEKEKQAQYHSDNSRVIDKTDASYRAAINAKFKDIAGYQLDLNMQLKPFVWTVSAGGIKKKTLLNAGRFRVFVNIVATNTNKQAHRFIINQKLSKFINGFIWNIDSDGFLNINLPLIVRINSLYGDLSLALKIIPVNLGANVQEFSAVYKLGSYKSLSSRLSPFKDSRCCEIDNSNGKLTYEQFLQTARNYKEYNEGFKKNLGIAGVSTLKKAEPFVFNDLKILFSRILPNETSTQRTIQYEVNTCINNTATGEAMSAGSNFKVTTNDKDKDLVLYLKTDHRGCLNWFGLISHKYYKKEYYIKKTAIVEYLDSSTKAVFIKNLEYYINPWDEKFTFGRDARIFSKERVQAIKNDQKLAPPSRLFIADFVYETMGFRYEIDKYMNLTVKKRVLLKLFPKVLKYNSLVSGRNATYPLRDGIYLMKVGLQKYYLDAAEKGIVLGTDNQPGGGNRPIMYSKFGAENLQKKQFVSAQTKLVKVLGGMIITPVEFELKDLRLMRIRSELFVQLQTIDENLLRMAVRLDGNLKLTLGDVIDKAVKKDNASAMQKVQIAYNNLKAIDSINKKIDSITNSNSISLINALQKKKLALQAKISDVLGVPSNDRAKFSALIKYINVYRNLSYSAQSLVRNHKRQVINLVISEFKKMSAKLKTKKRELLDRLIIKQNALKKHRSALSAEERKKLPALADIDPIQLYYHLSTDSSLDEKHSLSAVLQKLLSKKLINKDDIEEFNAQDFAVQTLQPNYDFELLDNSNPQNENFSGLASRTFMGPLTFIHDGNGSSFRPTDILNEDICPTAMCSVPDSVEANLNMSHKRGDLPPSNIGETNYKHNVKAKGRLQVRTGFKEIYGNLLVEKMSILDYSDSVNKNYERNKYYGFSGFKGVTVDDLIQQEKLLTKEYESKMKLQSQIGNYLEVNKLNFVSLRDNYDNYGTLDKACISSASSVKVALKCIQGANKSNKNIISSKNWFNLLHPEITDLNNYQDSFPQGWFESLQKEGNTFKSNKFVNSRKYRLFKNWKWNLYNFVYNDIQWSKGSIKKVGLLEWKDIINSKQGVDIFKPKDRYQVMLRVCSALIDNLYNKEFTEYLEQYRLKPTYHYYNKRYKNKNKKLKEHLYNAYKLCANYSKAYIKAKEALLPDVEAKIFKTYPPIVFENKLRVFETTGRYIYKGGKSLNINVGASFELSHSDSFQASNELGLDYMKILKPFTDFLGDYFSFANKATKSDSDLLGMINFNGGFNTNESVAREDGTVVSEGTFLVSQSATLDIEIGKYEKCTVVRLGKFLLNNIVKNLYDYYGVNQRDITINYKNVLGVIDLKQQQKYNLASIFAKGVKNLNKGTMVCTGVIEEKKIPIRENYFYFTQHFTQGDLQDTAAISNHPWLLQLRGVRDYRTFLAKIRAKKNRILDVNGMLNKFLNNTGDLLKSWLKSAKSNNSELTWKIIEDDQYAWPLKKLGKTYYNVQPTYPGMYTYLDEPNNCLVTWPCKEATSFAD